MGTSTKVLIVIATLAATLAATDARAQSLVKKISSSEPDCITKINVAFSDVACAESAPAQFQLEPAFPNLSFSRALDLQHPGDGSNRLFVVRQKGIIKVFDNNPAVFSAPIFLDLRNRVTNEHGEQGLLGLAFHPDFANNGFFYVYYTAENPLRSIIARYEVDPSNPNQGDPNSELIVLEIAQPHHGHNGGQIAFGPDGFLYIALGDGKWGGDPEENGQNPETLHGSILRIDVDKVSSVSPDCGAGPNASYTIPANNPLADGPGNNCDEIWAYGFRNPWRFSFDTATGALWAGDVGESNYEEIDLIQPGGNYGWNTMEGAHCFDPPTNCDQTGLELPIWEYEHSGTFKSVTGGYVYWGTSVPELRGQYIYADFINGKIWALGYDGQQSTNTQLLNTNLGISSFGVDEHDELYLVNLFGHIYRFTPTVSFTIRLKRVYFKSNGAKRAVIKWNASDVSTGKIDFYIDRVPDGNPDTRAFNDGKLKLSIPFPGDGPFDIQACERNSTTGCSNMVRANFITANVSNELDDDETYASIRDTGENRALAVQSEPPNAFAVFGNYPNPFNAQTIVRFGVPESAYVKLVIYDLLGRQVRVLVEDTYAAGMHEVVFEASDLPNGTYLVRLDTVKGSFVQTMQLVK